MTKTFGCYGVGGVGGQGGLSESDKKGKFETKIFFSDNVEWSSKNSWKMISADVKANIKQQELKGLGAVSSKFL